jgi:hypothetical protein
MPIQSLYHISDIHIRAGNSECSREQEYNAVFAEKDETVEEYKARLIQVEKIIMTFLSNLLKTADKPYINWPNRKPILEAQIQKILTLTRG